MALAIVESHPAVSDTELDALQKRLGIELPEDYRRFLCEHNGGRPVPKTFSFVEGKAPTQSNVAWFLAVYDGRGENFEMTFRTFKVRSRRLPENLVPMARDPFGNLICMSFSGTDKGAIYFWDHEKETRKADYRNCYLIAKSLEEFLSSLHELTDTV